MNVIGRLTQKLTKARPGTRPVEPDLHQLAIETLPSQGTPFAVALAAEIDRGHRHPPNDSALSGSEPARRSGRSWGLTRPATQQTLNAARVAALATQQRDLDHRRAMWEAEHRQQVRDQDRMLEHLRPARRGEYEAWLRGYLQAGGQPTHYYDHPTPRMWVAVTDLHVLPLYGATALKAVLVPDGIRVSGDDTGHTNLYITRRGEYLHQGFHDRAAGVPSFVAVYGDTDIS